MNYDHNPFTIDSYNQSMKIIQGTVLFNHKSGCQQCTTVGEYNREFRNVSFPNIDAKRRTNEEFRNRVQPSHHKEDSPFEELGIDMIRAFPTSDPLHLLELGVMRRCLYRWVFGAKQYRKKWPKALTDMTSRLLTQCQREMPSDIHRAVRKLDCLRYWKGLEYRTILLYVGCVVFKHVLPTEEYNHFLILFVAVRLCSSGVYKKKKLASKLFRVFVQRYASIYGRHTIGSNVHNLVHICEDMKSCGVDNLMDISTYKFENCLRIMGLDIKHTNLPLEQVVCRTIERNRLPSSRYQFDSIPSFEPKVFNESRLESSNVYRKIEISLGVFLSSRKKSDSWFMTMSKDIIKLEYVTRDGMNFKLHGWRIKEKGMFFMSPISSIKLDIYESNGELETKLKPYEIQSFKAKMLCLTYKSRVVFIPLLHTIQK